MIMNHNINRHFRICFGLLLMLTAGTAFAQQPPPGCYKSEAACHANQTNCSPTKWICPGQGSQGSSSSNSSSSSYSNNAARTEAIANGVSTLIDIFSAGSARKQQEQREWEEQSRQFRQEQANSKSLFDSMAPVPQPSRAVASSGGTSSANPWAAPDVVIKSSKDVDLERSQCLKIVKNNSGSAYIGHLSVQNGCSEPITFSFCYLSGGGDSWGDWECKQNAQGNFDRGADVVGAGDTSVLPSSLPDTVVALAACARPGLPSITSINQRQSGSTCK